MDNLIKKEKDTIIATYDMAGGDGKRELFLRMVDGWQEAIDVSNLYSEENHNLTLELLEARRPSFFGIRL